MMEISSPPTAAANGRWQQLQVSLQVTPGRMRLLSGALVVAAIVAGALGAQAFQTAQGALDRAQANAQQLVLIQRINGSIVRADADATNAFLVGGLEPPSQRADYDAAIDFASGELVRAAQAQPADSAALADLNRSLADYVATVQTARTNNRQGLPIGAEYLRQASASLRSQALPQLANLSQANQDRAQQEFQLAQRSIAWLLVGYPLVFAAFALAMWWLARRTRRYLNLPLVAASAILVLTFVAGLVVIGGISGAVSDIRSGPYSATRALAQARASALVAASNESLTLISRGSGKSFEDSWRRADDEVIAGLNSAEQARVSTTTMGNYWSLYQAAHMKIRSLDNSGNWDEAVAASTKPGVSQEAFADFTASSATALTDASESLTQRLDQAGRGLTLATWLAFAAGIAAAVLAWSGFNQRIEEYR